MPPVARIPQRIGPSSRHVIRLLRWRVPGAFVMLGACPPGSDPATAPFNHSADAVFDDEVLADGAALYAELALRRLAAS
jgi:metal-dependent amidase/aminoacylase/carboxypeptidase family protein